MSTGSVVRKNTSRQDVSGTVAVGGGRGQREGLCGEWVFSPAPPQAHYRIRSAGLISESSRSLNCV